MISENLFNLRKQFRFSQEQVAERIGVSRQAVAKWEAGDSIPDVANCAALARLYEVTLDELVNFKSEEALGLQIAPHGKYMFGTVTVGERGQIVIPVKARKLFSIHPGDDLVVLGDIEQGLALVKAEVLMDMLQQLQQTNRKDSDAAERRTYENGTDDCCLHGAAD